MTKPKEKAMSSSEKLDELIKKKKMETSALKKILEFQTEKENKKKPI